MMTNEQILEIALAQHATDMNCQPEDFLKDENVFVVSKVMEGARDYLKLPFLLDIVHYKNNVVVSGREDLLEIARKQINKNKAKEYRVFETPYLYSLNEELSFVGLRICHMAEYFLPRTEYLKPLSCKYKLKVLEPFEFQPYYNEIELWSNALCDDSKRRQRDVLAVGAYDGEKLVGLAGASSDSSTMWQIGIDVLPEYRKNGIAAALTSNLALEVLKRGKVPFYCAAWSNVKSVNNAIRSGFRPAWVEITAKPIEKK